MMFFLAFTCSIGVYLVGYLVGVRHYKRFIQQKQSIGLLVIEDQDNLPPNIYLAIESYERLEHEGSEIILQVKRN